MQTKVQLPAPFSAFERTPEELATMKAQLLERKTVSLYPFHLSVSKLRFSKRADTKRADKLEALLAIHVPVYYTEVDCD